VFEEQVAESQGELRLERFAQVDAVDARAERAVERDHIEFGFGHCDSFGGPGRAAGRIEHHWARR